MKECKHITSACGLANLGNTCYINTALQCIAHSSHLRKCIQEKQQHHYMYRLLANVLNNIWTPGYGTVVSPDEFVKGCHHTMASVITPHRQHDITEFVMTLFNLGSGATANTNVVPRNSEKNPVDLMVARIQASYKDNATANSPLGQCVAMQTVAQMNCGACAKKEHRFEHTSILFVPPIHRETLSHCINKTFECETTTDWTCDHCKMCKPSKLSRKVTVLPKVLIVAINRFDANMDKVKDQVLIEFDLDLSHQTILMSRSKTKKYRLSSIACHSGSGLHYGHYYAIALCGNEWVRYDDDSKMTETHECGGFMSRDAYLAMYELVEV